jgi:hypothetical protein
MKELTTAVSPFKMSENVKLFLNAAQTYGVKSIFTPDDLVLKKNLHVVYTFMHSLADLVRG